MKVIWSLGANVLFFETRIQRKLIDLFSYTLWKATPSYKQVGEWVIN